MRFNDSSWCPSVGLAKSWQQAASHSSYGNERQELQISLCLHPGYDSDSGMVSQCDYCISLVRLLCKINVESALNADQITCQLSVKKDVYFFKKYLFTCVTKYVKGDGAEAVLK